MYDPKIEELINAALADGVLTEKEKQVLFKRAESMGIDLDEFEMVLQSKLYEKQKEIDQTKAESSASPKSNKMGDIKKCPACGAIVSSYQVKCPECGYEFSDIKANLSSQLLAQKLDEVSARIRKMKFKDGGFWEGSASEQRQEEISRERQRVIEAFPIPATKADLLEFITSLKPRALDSNAESWDAYKKKFDECVAKAKLLFKDDEMFKPIFEELDEEDRKRKKKKTFNLCLSGAIVLAIIITALVSILLSKG